MFYFFGKKAEKISDHPRTPWIRVYFFHFSRLMFDIQLFLKNTLGIFYYIEISQLIWPVKVDFLLYGS